MNGTDRGPSAPGDAVETIDHRCDAIGCASRGAYVLESCCSNCGWTGEIVITVNHEAAGTRLDRGVSAMRMPHDPERQLHAPSRLDQRRAEGGRVIVLGNILGGLALAIGCLIVHLRDRAEHKREQRLLAPGRERDVWQEQLREIHLLPEVNR